MSSNEQYLRQVRGNVMGRDEYAVLNVPRVFVFRAASFVLSTGLTVGFTWDTLVYDSDGMWVSTNPTVITCRTTGLYALKTWCLWPANATSYREMWITRNAVLLHTSVIAPNAVPTVTGQEISREVTLNAGDIVGMSLNQATGGNLTLPASGGSSTYDHGLQATLISTT